jgi:AcrR family transcriptional regulator
MVGAPYRTSVDVVNINGYDGVVTPSSLARPRRKPAARYHHGDLRRALLQEAVRIIAADGGEALTLRQVGARLGVSRTALYRHFADKSALLAAVAREGFQAFAADLLDAWMQAPATPRGLELMGRAYIRFALTHRSHYRVMFGDFRQQCEKDPGLQADAETSFRVLVDALVMMQAAGQVRPDDVTQQARYVWAIVHGIAMLAMDGQLGPADAGTLDPLVDVAMLRLRTGIGVARSTKE